MLWMNLSSAQSILIQQSLFNIVAVQVSSISVHLIYLLFNFGIVKLMKLPTHEGIAVLIMSSQKSAAVAINIISYIMTMKVKESHVCFLIVIFNLFN